MTMHALPKAVVDALARGEKIEAIKLLREATGLGLKEAKDAVDAYAYRRRQDHDASASTTAIHPDGGELIVPQAAAEALRHGQILDAIRMIRNANRIGLNEAKAAVESLQNSSTHGATEGARVSSKREIARTPTVVQGDRSSGAFWIVLIAIIAAALWWWLSGESPV